MSEPQRCLYPEGSYYDDYTGEGWVVREEVDSHHVVFESEVAEDYQIHVEGDLSPVQINVLVLDEHKSTLLADSFQEGLEQANELMYSLRAFLSLIASHDAESEYVAVEKEHLKRGLRFAREDSSLDSIPENATKESLNRLFEQVSIERVP